MLVCSPVHVNGAGLYSWHGVGTWSRVRDHTVVFIFWTRWELLLPFNVQLIESHLLSHVYLLCFCLSHLAAWLFRDQGSFQIVVHKLEVAMCRVLRWEDAELEGGLLDWRLDLGERRLRCVNDIIGFYTWLRHVRPVVQIGAWRFVKPRLGLSSQRLNLSELRIGKPLPLIIILSSLERLKPLVFCFNLLLYLIFLFLPEELVHYLGTHDAFLLELSLHFQFLLLINLQLRDADVLDNHLLLLSFVSQNPFFLQGNVGAQVLSFAVVSHLSFRYGVLLHSLLEQLQLVRCLVLLALVLYPFVLFNLLLFHWLQLNVVCF